MAEANPGELTEPHAQYYFKSEADERHDQTHVRKRILRRDAATPCRATAQMRWPNQEQRRYSVANSHIDWLDSLPLAETLSESTFDARQLLYGRMTVYICLPVDRIAELAGVQRLILSSFIQMAFAAGEDPHRQIRFLLLDEAATLGKLDGSTMLCNLGDLLDLG